MNNVKHITYIAIMASVCLILGFIESLFPSPIAGVKLGLSNIPIMLALLNKGNKFAVLLMIIKVLLTLLLFANFMSATFALAGGCLSLIAMCMCKKMGAVFASVAGAVMHNAGQILCAVFVLNSLFVFYYLPVLIVSGIIMGVITGKIVQNWRKLS